MKGRKIFLTIIVVCNLYCSKLFPTDFVNVKVGARSLAMGNAFTAISDDANLLQFNPAGLALLLKKEIMFSYVSWLGDTPVEYVSYVHPGLYKSLNFGIGLQWFDLTLKKTDLKGVEMGDLKVRESNTVCSIATKIKEEISVGLNFKVVSSSLGKYASTGLLLDAGVLWLTSFADIGASVVSFQVLPFKYGAREESVSSQLCVGLAKFMKKFCVGVDVVKELNTAAAPFVRAGAEYYIFPQLAIQGGYSLEYEAQNIFLGCRLNLLRGEEKYILNVAFGETSISSVYAVSFNIKF
jgi:hypothetical protein